MKESEFETKLTTVSDAKLLQMLVVGRRDGPEVAVKMIQAEGSRRGLPEMETPAENAHTVSQVDAGVEEAMSAAVSEAVGYADLAPVEESPREAQLSDEAVGEAPKWLTEENSGSKFSPLLKALILIVALGAVVAVAYSFIHRG